MVNNYVAVYDKSGNLQSGFPKAADTFFGLASGTYTTDPRAFYDWDSAATLCWNSRDQHRQRQWQPQRWAVAWASARPIIRQEPGMSIPITSNRRVVCARTSHTRTRQHDWDPRYKGGIYIGLNLWSGANDCMAIVTTTT